MFKIVRDPTVYPIRSVDLSLANARADFVPATGLLNLDETFVRPDGGSAVWGRPARAQVSLAIRNGLSFEQYEELVRIREDGHLVCLFPNFDEHTLISAPLSRSLYYWKRTEASAVLAKTLGTFTRASTAWYLDRGGHYIEAASGAARYSPSALGDGFVQEYGSTNLFNPTHPSSGTLGWAKTGGGGSAVAWTTERNSIVRSKGGTAKLAVAAGSGTTTYALAVTHADATTSGNLYYSSVWVTGTARVVVTLTNGGSFDVSAAYTLSNSSWTRISVDLPKTDASTTHTLQIAVVDDGHDATVYVGPATLYTVASAFKYLDKEWGDSAQASDSLVLSASIPSGEQTVVCCGLFPPPDSQANLWSIDSAETNLCRVDIADTITYHYSTASAQTLSIPNRDSYSGLPFWLCVVVNPEAETVTITLYCNGETVTVTGTSLGIKHRNGTALRIGSSTFDSSGSTYIQHVRLDRRAWTSDERSLHRKMFIEAMSPSIIAKTTGKWFQIGDVDLSPAEGRWEKMVGTITLTEAYQDNELRIGL